MSAITNCASRTHATSHCAAPLDFEMDGKVSVPPASGGISCGPTSTRLLDVTSAYLMR
jgi:hypothetical protein